MQGFWLLRLFAQEHRGGVCGAHVVLNTELVMVYSVMALPSSSTTACAGTHCQVSAAFKPYTLSGQRCASIFPRVGPFYRFTGSIFTTCMQTAEGSCCC